MSSIIARPFSDIARSPSYSPRSLSTLVHFAPAEQTTINCKHLGCDYRFRLPRYVARLASCIDACSLSSMFPSLLVRHRRANPLSRGIISPVYTTAGVYVHKDAFSFYPLRIETCTTPRVTPYHTMPSRRVASICSVLHKVLHQARSRIVQPADLVVSTLFASNKSTK